MRSKKQMPDGSQPFVPFVMPEPEPDYHAVYSVQVCELVNDGFDVFGDEGWDEVDWPSDDDQESWLSKTRERLEGKLLRKFWFAEIDPRVPGIWRYDLTTKMQLVMPKYKQVYVAIANGLTPLAERDTYEKNRRVYSDYPAAQLDNQTRDYASTADDYESERVELGNVVEQMEGLRTYNDVDAAVLNELECCFCQVLTATIGGM